MTRTRKAWSKTIEEMGVAVRIYERAPGSVLSREVRTADGKSRKSLGTRDRKLAETQARALARQLSMLRNAGQTGPLTLASLVALYEQHRVPQLTPARQKCVRGWARLWLEHLDGGFQVEDLQQADLDGFAEARATGRLLSARAARAAQAGAAGADRAAPARAVRAGTIYNECRHLVTMFRWARGFRVAGRRILTLDPAEGLKLPAERNRRRPVATQARYLATLDVAKQVDPMGRFRLLLALARHTGRRVSAICALQADDVLRGAAPLATALAAAGMDAGAAAHWPHGAIRWRAEHDKRGILHLAPLNAEARAELDAYLAAHPRLGAVPLLPRTDDATAAIDRSYASNWLRRAEKAAGLPPLAGGHWHPYRRLWASERRHLPPTDVAAAGGWKSVGVLQAAYQHSDSQTVYGVVANLPGAVLEHGDAEAGEDPKRARSRDTGTHPGHTADASSA